MRGFTSYLEAHQTEPLENILSVNGTLYRRYQRGMRGLYHLARESNLVAFHEARLGKAKGTFTGEFRHYVWEGPRSWPWRIFVANRKGVSFEVPMHFKARAAMRAWEDYLTCLSVADSVFSLS